MKRIAAPLAFLAACSGPAGPMDIASSADAGVQLLVRPVTVTPGTTDSLLSTEVTIKYSQPWDYSLQAYGVQPLASWVCPPMYTAMASEDGSVYYGEQHLSGPTSIDIAPAEQCSATRTIRSCTYKFPAIAVSSRQRVAVWTYTNVQCGHGLTGLPATYFTVTPGPLVLRAIQTIGGPWTDKAWWKREICDSGCYGCGSEWYNPETSLTWHKCTYNPQAHGCLTPCYDIVQSW